MCSVIRNFLSMPIFEVLYAYKGVSRPSRGSRKGPFKINIDHVAETLQGSVKVRTA